MADASSQMVILEGQLRECYGRVVYSHKTHEKCADKLLRWHSRFKWSQIILSAVTTAGLVAVVFGDSKMGAIIGAIASVALLALNSYAKDFDFGAVAQKHRQAGADLWLIRETYLSLLTDLRMISCTIEELREQRDKLVKRLHSVYSGAPSTNLPAYTKAQEALQKLEDMTFSDAEIDAFLPRELRRAGQAEVTRSQQQKDESPA